MPPATPQVLQEIQDGQGVGMAEVAKSLPGVGGGSLDNSTPYRWTREGVSAPGGRRVILASVRIGKRVLTSRPALQRFILETSGIVSQSGSATPIPAVAAGV